MPGPAGSSAWDLLDFHEKSPVLKITPFFGPVEKINGKGPVKFCAAFLTFPTAFMGYN